jgi:hypothetical protein
MLSECEQERQRLLAEMNENETGWQERYRPGSFGCHELLDRASLVADVVEQSLVNHPACFMNAEWYALADQAMSALHELYQRVGAAAAADENNGEG